MKIIKVINDFNPKWIYVQPYILRRILYYYKFYHIDIPSELRYIESYGEVLSPMLKNEVISFFGVPVANMYGAEEVNAIAYECPFGEMHIFSNNVLVECNDKERFNTVGGGNTIVTSLCNHGMPLIRYNLGDLIEIKNSQKCMCKSTDQVITKICGRERNCITIDGYEINDYIFTEVIDEVNNQFNDPILRYRLIYRKKMKQFDFYISLYNTKQQWFDEIIKSITKIFLTKIPLYDVSLKFFKYELDDIYKNKFNILDIIE